MVLRQCVACNFLITESTRSCVCGHVLEDANRYIGGKRFSEYRAELYSRLESKRKKRESREYMEQLKPPKQLKELMPRLSEQSGFNKPLGKGRTAVTRKSNKKKRSRKRLPREQSSPSNKQQRSKEVVPPELMSRFPSALQEINRRIMGQNFIWMALQLDL